MNKALFLLVVACVLLLGSNSFALESTNTLENQVCTADDAIIADAIKENLPSVRSEGLYVGINTVLELYKNNQKNQLALVDVRSLAEYEVYRIPSSLHIPLHQLKYKAYLKNKIVVLVNSGREYKDIEGVVASLRLLGFKSVSILEGGMRKWYQEANILDGQAGEAQHLNLISVKEFLAEANHGPWLVFDIDKEPSFKTKVNGEVIHLPYDSVFGLNVSSKLNEREFLPLTRLLFVSNDKDIYNKIVPLMKQKGMTNYYILSEITDYIKVYQQNTLLATYAKNKLETGCDFR